jgi:hypothetical protein
VTMPVLCNAHDKDAQHRELTALHTSREVNPLASCGPRLTGMFLPLLPMISSRRHQSVADRLAGIVVIETGDGLV